MENTHSMTVKKNPPRTFTALAIRLAVMVLVGGIAPPANAKPMWLLENPDSSFASARAGQFGRVSAAQQPIFSDTAYALCHVATVQAGQFGGSDCWGYTDSQGRDYAIMGINVGLVFVDAQTQQVIDTVPGPTLNCGSVFWRDIKSMGQYCYAVSECTGTNAGILVIDMQYLPDSVHAVTAKVTSSFGTVTSHNLSVDSVGGYLYVEGGPGTDRNVYIHDLSDPANPIYVGGMGTVTTNSIHDIYAYNDTVYVAEGSNSAFSIWDVTNKLSPQLITRWTTPSGGYAHNIWPTDDRNYVATTEETSFRTVKIWDISDFGNIQLVGEYLAPGNLAHNAQFKGDRLYLSHYESGIRVVDITDPANPAEIGAYDTYPANESPSFNGAWGVYNYSPNGYVYGSNDDGQLFILQESEFAVSDTIAVDTTSGAPGSKVQIDIIATNELPTQQFIVPFKWTGPASITLDSVSTAGTRTDYFEELNLIQFNPFAQEAAYSIVSSTAGTSPSLDPGSGPILTLYFNIAAGSPQAFNPVVVTTLSGTTPSITSNCGVALLPGVVNGGVDVCAVCGSCCVVAGDSDHSGTFNIADVTFDIARIFSGGPAPFCADEADADGDNTFNIADVTYGIAFIFSGGPAPVCGTTGQ